MRTLILSLSCAVMVLVAGCSKKVGGNCSQEKEAECRGGSQALLCYKGKWMEVQCRGPKGCSEKGGVIECDESLAQVGDGCHDEGNLACSSDKKAIVSCSQGKWTQKDACGSKNCVVTGNTVGCE